MLLSELRPAARIIGIDGRKNPAIARQLG